MKRMISTVGAAALLAGALLAPALLRAEDKAEKPAQEEGRHRGGMRAMIKEKLGLTDEQEAKLKSLRRAHREASESAKTELKAAMRKLGDQLEDKAGDKDLAATLDKIKAGRRALRDAQDKFEADSAAVLTPTQRAKMVVAMGRMMKGGMRGHGRGMRGHGGWGEHEGGGAPARGPRHDDDEMDD